MPKRKRTHFSDPIHEEVRAAKAAGFNSREIAELVGISQSTVCRRWDQPAPSERRSGKLRTATPEEAARFKAKVDAHAAQTKGDKGQTSNGQDVIDAAQAFVLRQRLSDPDVARRVVQICLADDDLAVRLASYAIKRR